MSRRRGYFLVYRDVWKHPVFKNLIEASIWLYMISSASHKPRTLMFVDNPINVNVGELIFPIRKNAKIWNISYSSLRTFLVRLKRRKMITIRVIRTQPTPNHRFNSVSVINVCNYSRFQFNEELTNQHLAFFLTYLSYLCRFSLFDNYIVLVRLSTTTIINGLRYPVFGSSLSSE